MFRLSTLALICLLAATAFAADTPQKADWPPKIERKLPPPGDSLSADEDWKLHEAVVEIRKQAAATVGSPLGAGLPPDVEVFAKAIEYSLRNGELFLSKKTPPPKTAAEKDKARENDHKKYLAIVDKLRTAALARIDAIRRNDLSWTKQRGSLVRGFRSKLDDSVQPYGLIIPEKLDLSKRVPLYVWLHGRGDTDCDLQFIYRFLSEKPVGQFLPQDAIVLHPFGRFCNGFKSAGEVDVLEAIETVKRSYTIDANRIVLAGFSMGGAGAWHLGAHYADRWCAVHAGAGFVDVRRYQKLTPETMPPAVEQKLWGLYDVPDYRRNLLNVPVLAYSGEQDAQKAAADIMEAELAAEGYKIPHLIGPGMGHKYHPDVLVDIHKRLAELVAKGRDRWPEKVSLQTRTLRYNRMFWVEALGLAKHWEDSRIDAEWVADNAVSITTKNITALRLERPWQHAYEKMQEFQIVIDKESLQLSIPHLAKTDPDGLFDIYLTKRANGWKAESQRPFDYTATKYRRKLPGLQGPIDDAFMSRFWVMMPATLQPGASPSLIDRWADFESKHFVERWRLLMRGDALQIRTSWQPGQNMVLWGTPSTNPAIKEIVGRLPLRWDDKIVGLGDLEFDATKVVPALIYPNPDDPEHYIVINSGLTFREADDRTNSLQNPKLGDWAFIDVTEPPSAEAPGKVLATGFFDEEWQVAK
jgi:dienelactone hydrolase